MPVALVHPHVCGEHFFNCMLLFSSLGSSPRVWGTFSNQGKRHQKPRFIPTCVGNISPTRASGIKAAVHPHVCGEHLLNTRTTSDRNGSSPRVWGTCARQEAGKGNSRFIPTCVGNISLSRYPEGYLPVHPHVCGEHNRFPDCSGRQSGSSPRVWGTCSVTTMTHSGTGSSPRVWGT